MVRYSRETCVAHPREGGMTLIEILVSMTLLVIAAVSILPVMSMTLRNYAFNHMRAIAQDLATARMDEIRTLPYEVRIGTGGTGVINANAPQVGTVAGNPAGLLPQTTTQRVGNVDFTIKTQVSWVIETALGVSYTTGTKKAVVTVSATNPLSGNTHDFARLETLISKEGEKTMVAAGNILVSVYKEMQPQGAIPVTITKLTSTPTGSPPAGSQQNALTDADDGSVIFGELPIGATYSVNLTSGSPFMVEPFGVKDPPTSSTPSVLMTWKAPEKVITESDVPVNLNINYPVYLTLNLLEEDQITPVNTSDIWVSVLPVSGMTGTPGAFDKITSDCLPSMAVIRKHPDLSTLPIWTGYTYDIKLGPVVFSSSKPSWTPAATSDIPFTNAYILSKNTTQPLWWNGQFDLPSEPTSLTKNLVVKACKPTFTATLQSTGESVPAIIPKVGGVADVVLLTITPYHNHPDDKICYRNSIPNPLTKPTTRYTAPIQIKKPSGSNTQTVNYSAITRKEAPGDAMLDSDVATYTNTFTWSS